MNAEIKHIRTAAEQTLLDAFVTRKDALAGAKGERADAFKMFEEAGLPHRRVEEWKYTDLRALMRDAKPFAAKPDAAMRDAAKAAGALPGVEARRLVLLNGSFVPELSDLTALEQGLTVTSLSDALAGDGLSDELGQTVPTRDVAVALNTAFMTDGVVVRVADGAKIARPIAMVNVFAGEAAAVFTRSLLVVGADAEVTIIETFEGPAETDYQVNTGLEIVGGDRAKIDRVVVAREGDRALHLSSSMIRLGAEVKFNDFAFTTGGAVTRNQTFLRLQGDGAVVSLRGANLLQGRQHVDSTLVVDHAALGCVSRELFKHVLDDASRAVFQGKIIVQPGAQKTDGKMMTQALLLSEDAEADSKPELEIFADDVVCGHGATAGALDEDLLFYLRARGIPQIAAQALLVQAFVGEALEGIAHEGLRDTLVADTERWLHARKQMPA